MPNRYFSKDIESDSTPKVKQKTGSKTESARQATRDEKKGKGKGR